MRPFLYALRIAACQSLIILPVILRAINESSCCFTSPLFFWRYSEHWAEISVNQKKVNSKKMMKLIQSDVLSGDNCIAGL